MCEGGCERHEYGVQPVRVIDRSGTPHDWGYFAYCPAAIDEDKSRGMDVITEGQADFLPNNQDQVPRAGSGAPATPPASKLP